MDESSVHIQLPNKLEKIEIEQDKTNYLLDFKIKDDSMTLNISEKNEKGYLFYTRTMKLNEIKQIHKAFYILNSCNEFYEYIKTLSQKKEIKIKKVNNNLSINFFIEILFKKEQIEIKLFPNENKKLYLNVNDIFDELFVLKDKITYFENNYLKKDNDILEKIIKEILNKQLGNINIKNNHLEKENINLKNEINLLKDKLKIYKEENGKINAEINYLKQEIKKLKNTNQLENSIIIKPNEYNFIKFEIEKRMEKKIKSIKKLYQATIDSGEPINFHLKCDNIPNTLTFIESKGKRRFGGFTSLCWESSDFDKAKNDKNAFLFSLDKKEIYPVKTSEGKDAIRCKKDWGPCFGRGKDIGIEGDPIKTKVLRTYKSSYNYNGNINSLSEDNDYLGIYAKDYEVFQIIFEK